MHGPGIDEPLAVEQKGKVYYYHADGLGSIVSLTDSKGRVVESFDYSAFGFMQRQGGEVKQPYAYTGREWDKELGLYYYRARYYDPVIGRFISKDPIGFAGGDENLYRYVANGPVNWMDPWGLLKYNTPDTTITGRLTGETLNFAECMENCAGFELTVTGGSETSGHGEGSKHYTGEACDFSEKRNPALDADTAQKCWKKCAQPNYFGQKEGGAHPHWHFQIAPGKNGKTGLNTGGN